MNSRPRLTRRLVRKGLLPSDLVVVDVGASTGYQRVWRQFGEHLELYGFDPLVAEMERLNAEEPSPKIRYEHGFVTGRRSLDGVAKGDGLHGRLSAHRVREIVQYDPVRDLFNQGAPVVHSERRFTLDEHFASDRRDRIDVIKIDTDGADYDVLDGARAILDRRMLLGCHVEVRFTGKQLDDANLFRNVDRILGEAGLSIFHLDTRRYSRAALPLPFVKDKPSTTVRGQIRWGNALYLRDLGAPDYETAWERSYPLDKIVKLVCLFELFDLPDCAMEVVLKYADSLAGIMPVDTMQDRLTPEVGGERVGYRCYMAAFERMVKSRRFVDVGRLLGD